MVNIRPLPAEEVAQVFPKRGTTDIAEYVTALQDLRIGEAAEIDIDDLTSRAIKRRLGMAAKSLGMSLKWAKYNEGDEVLVFQLRAAAGTRAPRARRNSRTLVTA